MRYWFLFLATCQIAGFPVLEIRCSVHLSYTIFLKNTESFILISLGVARPAWTWPVWVWPACEYLGMDFTGVACMTYSSLACINAVQACMWQGRHGEFKPGKVQYSTPKFFDQLFLIRAYWNPKSREGPNLPWLPCRGGPVWHDLLATRALPANWRIQSEYCLVRPVCEAFCNLILTYYCSVGLK